MTSSEILPLVKLLAKVAVDEYLREIKDSNPSKEKENICEQDEQSKKR